MEDKENFLNFDSFFSIFLSEGALVRHRENQFPANLELPFIENKFLTSGTKFCMKFHNAQFYFFGYWEQKQKTI
ncbi:hypothetical protein BpHYR1_011389 [Brachionus plicatilis]|uniref:Uncharacterized protein n=1 Tax=Brachionus plicatilis TaxID=10195 RepID=A0A3M7PDB5_BRAPC|nr:hypothetical protein BpHYR1_011389 [Brachionus plicatilis]